MSEEVTVSVVVPVSERYDAVRELYQAYKEGVEDSRKDIEFLYVLDGDFPEVFEQLKTLQAEGEPIQIIKLAKSFGEATALTAGFEHASGEIFLSLPAYYQVEPAEVAKVLDQLDGHDMVVARRWPRIDSMLTRLQARVFNWMLNVIEGYSFHDLGCGVRAFRRQVVDEIPIYGDQHRFFPVLASQRGFRIKEVDVKQSPRDKFHRVYRPGVYLRRMLDILTVFFLVKFTKKPLRFFGLIGTFTFVLGGLFLTYLVFERLFLGVGLTERPALLLSSLLIVLGVQVFAMGLIGELIIFTHAKDIKEYTVEEIVG